MYKFSSKRFGRRELPIKERSLLYDRLALYVRSGIPLSEAMALMRDSAYRTPARQVYTESLRTISAGKPLSHAFSCFPRSFPPFETHVLRGGEESGRLPDNLSYLASLLRRKQQLTGKVRSALLYPFLVALLTLGLTVFLVCFAFPKIVPLFRGLRTPLPLSTRILIGIEDLLTHHTYMLLTVSLATIVGLTALICLSRLRPYREYLLLRTPLIGPLMRAYYLAVLSRILASLLQSGIPLYTSLTLARAGVQNGEFTEAVTAAEEGVYRGARLSEQLRERDGLFPPSLVGLIVAGEATGSLAASLSTVAELCETELDERTRTLTTLIEPALMILMGVLVGSVALAIVSPIYGITQNISAY